MANLQFGNQPSKVFIRHEPNAHVILVCYLERNKGQRHFRAQFDDRDHTIRSVSDWVRFTPGLELVCAISGISI